MNTPTDRTVERTIKRLTKEIAELDELFYGTHRTSDRFLYASMLEHKRDDFVRGAVLQLHTSIEDILSELISSALLGIKPRQRLRRARALRTRRGHKAIELLAGGRALGFAHQVQLAASLGITAKPMEEKLLVLNTLRKQVHSPFVIEHSRPAQ